MTNIVGVLENIKKMNPEFEPDSSHAKKDWYLIVREIYTQVSVSGNTERIDAFNRNYGLLRGIAASLLVVGVSAAICSAASWSAISILFILAIASGYRMYRFGKNYARELFLTYLICS